MEKIRGLPVEKWAGQDALLLMWMPVELLPDVLLLLRVWRFEYSGLLVWRKPNDFLTGFWHACQCEFILVAKRGTIKTSYLFQHAIYDGSRSEGSYKPEAFRALLLTAGFIAFDKVVPHLDLFGMHWQRCSTGYCKRDWDFLEM